MKTPFVIWFIIGVSIFTVESNAVPNKFEHVGINQGHSNDWVKAIYQDSLGFIWFGTNAGLYRYDGHSFKEFSNEKLNHAKLRSNNIYCLAEDHSNNLWIGTSKGLCKYNMQLNVFYCDSAWPDIQINKIIYHKNTIYAATKNGVFYINLVSGKACDLITAEMKILDQFRVNDLILGATGDLLVGTFRGLYSFDMNKKALAKIENKDSVPLFSEVEITSLYRDNQDRIWAGTFENGLFLIEKSEDDSHENIIHHFKNSEKDGSSISEGTIRCIIEDFQKNIWISVENKGVNLVPTGIKKTQVISFQKILSDPKIDESLTGNSVYAMLCDRDGNVWIGTYYEGINRLKRSEDFFNKYIYNPYINNGLINKSVNTISEIGAEIWIGTENGISIFNPSNEEFNNLFITPDENLPNVSNTIWSIIQDDDENVLIGTWGGGVYNYNLRSGAFSRFKNLELPHQNISSLLKDSNGNIWICTMGGGLVRYNREAGMMKIFNSESGKNAIANNWVLNIYENSKNEIWISTMEGMEILNNETDRFVQIQPGRLDAEIADRFNLIDVIYEDSEQNNWFASKNGLFYLNQADSEFGLYDKKNVLPTNLIKAILEDNHGNIWVSTNIGILKIENAVHLPKNPIVRIYDVNDNLQGPNFTIKCALKDKGGRLYFGGNDGFNMFHPDSIVENSILPRLVFTRLIVLNSEVEQITESTPIKKDISYANKLLLKHHQKSFSIEFVALNYMKSDKNKYAYFLQGVNKEWIELGNTNVIHFSNLKPEKYTLMVKGSNNDGVWNNTPLTLHITVLSPPWKTWWAFITYLLFILALLYYFRSNALQKERLKKYYLEKYQMTGLASIQPVQPEICNAEEQFISKMISVVEKHIDNPEFKNETFALELGMSVAKLYRKTKALLNCSPSVFIRDLRIKRALQLLSSGEFTISEVAYKVGFSDPNYFGKWFKNSYGKAPSDCQPKKLKEI